MNQDWRGPGRPASGQYDQRGRDKPRIGGSVKRARERVEAGLPPEQPRDRRSPSADNPNSPATWLPQNRSFPAEPRYFPTSTAQHQPRGTPASRPRPPPIGSAISRPTPASQTAQWPLQEEDSNMRKLGGVSTNDRPTGKGKAPQRPPRPSYVPSILDSSRPQEHTPPQYHRAQPQPGRNVTSRQQANYWEPDYPYNPSTEFSPPGTAGTGLSGTSGSSSRPSTSSSVGSIPDFPVPAIPVPPPPPQPTRRTANFGPPPSARRGASSYYSQNSYVAPIPEELPETSSKQTSHGSYASSHVIPTSWGDGPPEYYTEEGVDEEYEGEHREGEDGRESRGADHDESTGLVRQASLGKRHKPALTTIKSNDGLDRQETNRGPTGNGLQARRQDGSKPSLVSRAAIAAGATGGAFAAGMGASRDGDQGQKKNAFREGTALQDPSSSSDSLSGTIPGAVRTELSSITPSRTNSPARPPIDPRVDQILGGVERGRALQPSSGPSPLASTTSLGSEKVIKRPPKLNLDAVREAESRGSLTSLPDLILRATKLASNLDRGKTASRLGMLDMFGAGGENDKDRSPQARPRSGSISDILASFPPPGLTTPPADRPTSRWPSPFANSGLAVIHNAHSEQSTFDEKKRKRKCCGMPLWVFILVLILLVLLIAAAVVIPVTLIVLPRRQHDSSTPNLSDCAKTSPCQNGGTSLVSGNACRCVCSNGFTGSSCTVAADSACTNSNVKSSGNGGSFTAATMGSGIPRLLSAAGSNFSIPLNLSTVLSVFSATNLTCTSENALVTFNGESRRRDILLPVPILLDGIDLGESLSMSSPSLPSAATKVIVITETTSFSQKRSPPTITLHERQGGAMPTASDVTSNGLDLAASGTQASPTPTSSASSSSSGKTNTPSQTDLDFARVAVLFILQEENLDLASQAQSALNSFLQPGKFNGSEVQVGNGTTLDFSKGTIKMGNGSPVGGKGFN